MTAKTYHERMLNHIDDPVVRKTLIVRWATIGDISFAEAERLMREYGLEAA